MKNLIEEMMIQYFKKCSVDKYGQVGVIQPSSVFKEKTEEILEYIKSDNIISISTYGGRFGTYKGFFLEYGVHDEDIKRKCYDALKENESYKWAMTH